MFKKAIAYLKDVRQELSKVTWPSRIELWESTLVVLALSGILAIFVFAADLSLSKLLNLIF
jgi:preprotein translocase subunit SecE